MVLFDMEAQAREILGIVKTWRKDSGKLETLVHKLQAQREQDIQRIKILEDTVEKNFNITRRTLPWYSIANSNNVKVY